MYCGAQMEMVETIRSYCVCVCAFFCIHIFCCLSVCVLVGRKEEKREKNQPSLNSIVRFARGEVPNRSGIGWFVDAWMNICTRFCICAVNEILRLMLLCLLLANIFQYHQRSNHLSVRIGLNIQTYSHLSFEDGPNAMRLFHHMIFSWVHGALLLKYSSSSLCIQICINVFVCLGKQAKCKSKVFCVWLG